MIKSGKDLEARGDRSGAAERYWNVARFGQVIDSQARTNSEHLLGLNLQTTAYCQLGSVALKGGDNHEAQLFAYLAASFEQTMKSLKSLCPGGT